MDTLDVPGEFGMEFLWARRKASWGELQETNKRSNFSNSQIWNFQNFQKPDWFQRKVEDNFNFEILHKFNKFNKFQF